MNSNNQIRIVADGLVLEALKLHLNGTEFIGEYIQSGTALIVYAESLIAGAVLRSESGGLKRLQQLLSNPSSTNARITVFSFRAASSHGSYNYLVCPPSPIKYSQFPFDRPILQRFKGSKEQWRNLIRMASERELEIACIGYRHALRSVMGASRIYLGAAIASHVTAKQSKATLPKFEYLARQEDPSISLDSRQLLKQLGRHRRFRDDYKSIIKVSKTRVWVLDDHWDDHGWKLIFNDLMPGMVKGFSSWNAFAQQISKSGQRPDVLLIDCNLGLGDEIPTGLELLYSIRSLWQDVRIIFATAYDDAALALTSLREGANLFFAKALNDTMDRRSLDYYIHFSKLLQPNEFEKSVSIRWRAFQLKYKPGSLLTAKPGLPQPQAALNELLRLGFYILFSLIDRNQWWVGGPGLLTEEALFRAAANTIIVGYPDLEYLADNEDKSLAKIIRACTHGGEEISFPSLLRIFDFLLGKLEDQCKSINLPMKQWARPKPSYWPYQTRAIQTDSTHPGLEASAAVTTHEVAESQGALELVRGINCISKCKHPAQSIDEVLIAHKWKKGKKTYEDVVFVDDNGQKSGWFRAVESFLPDCRTYEDLGELFREIRLKRFETSLVLLDLKLPTYSEGLRALNRLLVELPSVPIVALSAGTDSLAAIKSLRSGAADFVSKTLPFPRSAVGCFEFADELRTKCQLLLKYGRGNCRNAGIQLDRLRRQLRWIHRKDLTIIMNKIRRVAQYSQRSSKSVPVDIPPDPKTWGRMLSEEIELILHLRRQVFWQEEKKEGVENRFRLNVRRTYQIRPIDYWRSEQVLASDKTADFVKIGAILSGVMIDRIARWNWCLENDAPLKRILWGTKFPKSISIRKEVAKINGNEVWRYRNCAIYPSEPQPKAWDQDLFDLIIDKTFLALKHFLSAWGAQF